MTRALLAAMIAAALFLTTAWAAKAEDGYDLWLRYPAVEAGAADYRAAATQLVVAGESPTLGVATDELERGLSGLLGAEPQRPGAVSRDGAGAYRDRLLPLPPFLLAGGAAEWDDIFAGLRLTGHFLTRDVLTGRSVGLAEARSRLAERLFRAGGLI